MKLLTKSFLVVALMQSFMPMISAAVDENVPTEREIRRSEGEPPLIPHRVNDADTARECLRCHETGKKGAPVTSHPERKACTQCHLPTGGFSTGKAKGKK